MNKSNSLFMRLALLIGFVVQCVLLQASTLIDGLYYDLDTSNRTATVTYEVDGTDNYASLPADVKIPESVTYDGVTYSVTEIGAKAFANCKVMESISIPKTVMYVGTSGMDTNITPICLPFYNCTSLKNVRFEDGDQILTLGSHNYAYESSNYDNYYYYYYGDCHGLFVSCPLESVYIGRSLKYSAAYSISYFHLKGYTFDDDPQYFGYSAFYKQTKLKSVTISSFVTELPRYLFSGCSSLETLSI